MSTQQLGLGKLGGFVSLQRQACTPAFPIWKSYFPARQLSLKSTLALNTWSSQDEIVLKIILTTLQKPEVCPTKGKPSRVLGRVGAAGCVLRALLAPAQGGERQGEC